MKPSELRGMSIDELRGELAEQERGYYNLRFRKSVGEDIHATETMKIRREIARIHTVITEKEMQLQGAADQASVKGQAS